MASKRESEQLWLHWLHIITGCRVVITHLDLLLSMFLMFLVEFHTPDGDRSRAFFEGRCQIDILRNDALVKQRDHTLINIVLRDRWRVLTSNLSDRGQLPAHRLRVLGSIRLSH